MRLRGKDKRPRKPYSAKPHRVISLIAANKIHSVADEKNTKQILNVPPPGNLNAIAKAEWKRMLVELAALGIFRNIDGTALALYCEAYAEWYKAGLELQKPGVSLLLKSTNGGARYRNPWADIQKSARKEMAAYLSMFGMSPYDRARITGAEGGKDVPPHKEPNEFDEF